MSVSEIDLTIIDERPSVTITTEGLQGPAGPEGPVGPAGSAGAGGNVDALFDPAKFAGEWTNVSGYTAGQVVHHNDAYWITKMQTTGFPNAEPGVDTYAFERMTLDGLRVKISAPNPAIDRSLEVYDSVIESGFKNFRNWHFTLYEDYTFVLPVMDHWNDDALYFEFTVMDERSTPGVGQPSFTTSDGSTVKWAGGSMPTYDKTTVYRLLYSGMHVWYVVPVGKGDTGAKGDKGDTGAQGLQGIQGIKGDTGLQGVKGDTGNTGPAGPGVAAGGSAGQVLSKVDGTNYNTQWVTPSAGGGSPTLHASLVSTQQIPLTNDASDNNSTPNPDEIAFVILPAPCARVLKKLIIEVGTAASASTLVEFGLYDASTMALIGSLGTVDLATSGTKTLTSATTLTLPPLTIVAWRLRSGSLNGGAFRRGVVLGTPMNPSANPWDAPSGASRSRRSPLAGTGALPATLPAPDAGNNGGNPPLMAYTNA